MLIQPSHYGATPVRELLEQAGMGRIGFDRRLARAIIARGPEAVEALVAYGMEPPESARLEMDADILNLVAAIGAPGKGLDLVLGLLKQGHSEISESILKIVRDAGAAGVDSLVALYRELEEEAGGEVAFLLAGLGRRDERILAICLERLEFDMEDGAMLLGLYGDPAGIEPLMKLSAELGKNREIDFAIEQLRAAAGAPVEEPRVDFLEEYDEERGPEFEVLDDDEIVEFATGHEDEAVRLAALDVLEDLELPQTAAAPLLDLARNTDATLAVRAAAYRALARLNQIEQVRAQAEAVMGDTGQAAALRAASLITLLPDGLPAKRVRELIEELLGNQESRPDAVQAMWRSREASYANRFGTFLEDPDLAVRRQAVRGAGVCGDVTAVGKLRGLLMDEDLRKDAIFAYALAVPTDVSPSRMRSLYSRIEKEAGGLNHDEAMSVGIALDMRLESEGKEPIFLASEEEEDEDELEGRAL
ncbi:MAG: hypothetical protein K7J46_01115 [Bryobacter sp.]|jgi:hypothetical protein|nr:hypothetical protein [Bryobacter sp. CoA8 C33]